MQIDLLATAGGELGIVANRSFDHDISGVIFDVGEQTLTLEFGAAMDSMKLNIPVGDDFVERVKKAHYLHVCAVDKNRMVYAKQVPLMKVSMDDDYFGQGMMRQGIISLQTWLKGAKFAQSVHRDNLGDTGSNGGIMHRSGIAAATLQVAPQLAQQLVREQQLVQSAQLNNVPRMGPPSLGPGSVSPQLGLNQMTPRAPDGNSGNKE